MSGSINRVGDRVIKAFIFDMDGVLVNSETAWEAPVCKLFGEVCYEKIKDNLWGSTLQANFELARRNGFYMDQNEFLREYEQIAISVYARSELTKGIDALIRKLVALNFKIGLVTSSPRSWIDWVLPRLQEKDAFSCILSLDERSDLRSKPSPDGYLEAMKKLNVTPENTIILEDSNNGVKAGKASRAFTIRFCEHLSPSSISEPADKDVANVDELIQVLQQIRA